MLTRSIPVLTLLGIAGISSATVLIFENTAASSLVNGDFISSTPYGHRVDAATVGTYAYGTSHGFTPNVTAAWSGTNGFPSGWGAGYSSLVNVVWGSGSSAGVNEIHLTLEADAGFFIEFRGLDVGRWTTGTYPGSYVTLTDADNNTVDLLTNTELGSTLSLDYNANPYLSTKFTLTFGQAWWTALDNVAFSQTTVPEPATLAALGAGLAFLGRRRRR